MMVGQLLDRPAPPHQKRFFKNSPQQHHEVHALHGHDAAGGATGMKGDENDSAAPAA
jgi:hypothetical protein